MFLGLEGGKLKRENAYGGAANGIPRKVTRSPVAVPWNIP